MSVLTVLPSDFQFEIDGFNYLVRAEMDAFAGAPTVNAAAQDPTNGEWSWMMLVEANQNIVDSKGGVRGFMEYALSRINAELENRHPNAVIPADGEGSLLEQLQAFLANSVGGNALYSVPLIIKPFSISTLHPSFSFILS